MSAGTSVWKEEHVISYKVPSLAYAFHACLNLYCVMIHLYRYDTRIQCYVMTITTCRISVVWICGMPGKVGLFEVPSKVGPWMCQ